VTRRLYEVAAEQLPGRWVVHQAADLVREATTAAWNDGSFMSSRRRQA
jgi:hypothetical protein